MSTLNPEIEAALHANRIEHARELLRDALESADAHTYFLAAKTAETINEQRHYLTKAIALDPTHAAAVNTLNQLMASDAPQTYEPPKSRPTRYAYKSSTGTLSITTSRSTRKRS